MKSSIQATGEALVTCQKKFCPAMLASAEEQKQRLEGKIQIIVRDLKAKKITPKQFIAKTQALKNGLMKSKIYRDLLTCSILKCDPELRALLTDICVVMKYKCKQGGTESECLKFKQMSEMLKLKKITVDDYLSCF